MLSHARLLIAPALLSNALSTASAGIDAPGRPAFEDELVRAELVASVQSVAPGDPFWLGVRFRIDDGWHINWINPGDAGLAPSIGWALPAGFVTGATEWPHPGRHIEGPLVIFGYEREVLFLARATPPAGLRPGESVELRAAVDWLACRESCIPGQADVVLELPVEAKARPDTAWARAFAEAAGRVPVVADRWGLRARYDDDLVTIEVVPVHPTTHDPLGVFFFPSEPGVIENAEAQETRRAGRGYEVLIPRSRTVAATPARLTGVLVSANGFEAGGEPRALQVDVPLEPR